MSGKDKNEDKPHNLAGGLVNLLKKLNPFSGPEASDPSASTSSLSLDLPLPPPPLLSPKSGIGVAPPPPLELPSPTSSGTSTPRHSDSSDSSTSRSSDSENLTGSPRDSLESPLSSRRSSTSSVIETFGSVPRLSDAAGSETNSSPRGSVESTGSSPKRLRASEREKKFEKKRVVDKVNRDKEYQEAFDRKRASEAWSSSLIQDNSQRLLASRGSHRVTQSGSEPTSRRNAIIPGSPAAQVVSNSQTTRPDLPTNGDEQLASGSGGPS